MTFDEYKAKAISTDVSKGKRIDSLTDPAFIDKVLGLVGEAGEFADKVKKIIRDRDGIPNPDDIALMRKELGDTLWYIATVAYYLNFSLDQVAAENLDKLADRQKRGKIKGAGDNR